jgi:hypothetical protein
MVILTTHADNPKLPKHNRDRRGCGRMVVVISTDRWFSIMHNTDRHYIYD